MHPENREVLVSQAGQASSLSPNDCGFLNGLVDEMKCGAMGQPQPIGLRDRLEALSCLYRFGLVP